MMLIASNFLPVIFTNLPPILGSHHLWTIIWVISLFVFFPKVFLNKCLLPFYFYCCYLLIMVLLFWENLDPWNRKFLLNELYHIGIALTIFSYYKTINDVEGFAKTAKYAFYFLCITAVMSIVSGLVDPMYARKLMNISKITNINSINELQKISRLGGGTYSSAIAFMSIIPILFFQFKEKSMRLISKKNTLFFLLIIFFALLSMQIFTNILIAIGFGIISFLSDNKKVKTIILLFLFFALLFLIPNEAYVSTLGSFGSLFSKDSHIYYKLNDLAIFISEDSADTGINTAVETRAQRYPDLLQVFFNNPIMGFFYNQDPISSSRYKLGGAHIYWMNKLTTTGLFGFIIFLMIPSIFINKNLHNFHDRYKIFYLLATLSILSYGFFKNLSGRDAWYMIFVILPGINYFQYLPKMKNKRVIIDQHE